jgi:hypothetical protein
MFMVQGIRLPSALENTPQYSRQKCMPLWHVQWRIWLGAKRTETPIFYLTVKQQLKPLTTTQLKIGLGLPSIPCETG